MTMVLSSKESLTQALLYSLRRYKERRCEGPAMPITLGFDVFVVALVILVIVTIAFGVSNLATRFGDLASFLPA